MKPNNKVMSMTIAAMLCAIRIVIPMVAPRIVMGPISFTLASHVAIFIAMFISPQIAISVALVTGIGFQLAGFPIEIVLRAFTHVIFAALGAFILKKNGSILLSAKNTILFSLLIAVVHAIAEVLAITTFYWITGKFNDSFFTVVFIGIGLGTIIHSMVDFTIAVIVWKPLQHIVLIPASAKIKAK
jgi:niacin transporter